MNKIWDLAHSLLPVFMGVVIAFGTWVTTEISAGKYTRLTAEDGRRIKAEAVQEAARSSSILLKEINRLRDSVDELKICQAETLAEVRFLREHLTQ